MKKAGGIIALIAGVFGLIAAVVTLTMGGLVSAVGSVGGNQVVSFGWGGIFYSLLIIVFGAIALSSKDKVAGIMLIITSVLGAIFGGTLVAICMFLSLVGGTLACIGTKSTQPLTRSKWIIWSLVITLIAVITFTMFSKNDNSNNSDKNAIMQLEQAQLSSLQPTGELAEIFELGSQYTELQRENKLNEIKGQVVFWKLPVYDVKREDDGYKIQTNSGLKFNVKLIETFIYVTPRNDEERKLIEALKTDDVIMFKGVIAGTMMRDLIIKPAILVKQAATPAVPQAAEPIVPRAQAQTPAPEVIAPESGATNGQDDPSSATTQAQPQTPAPADGATVPTAGQPQTTSQTMWKPSFDCTKATIFAEKAICTDSLLGKLDGVLSENYKLMLASNIGEGANNELKTTQKKWLIERNNCSTNQCLIDAYRKRVDEVCDYPVISGIHPDCTPSEDIK